MIASSLNRRDAIAPSLVLAAALVCALLVLVGVPRPIEIGCGVLLVFVLPGWAWRLAVPPDRMASFGPAALVVMGSLGITMVVGVMIDVLPGGLTLHDWVIGQTFAIGAGTVTALVHRPAGLPPADVAWPSVAGAGVFALKVGTLAAMLAVAVLVSLRSQSHLNAEQHFAVLSVVAGGDHPAITVVNHEGAPERFTLVAAVNGRTVTTEAVPTSAGQTVHPAVTVPSPGAGRSGLLSFVIERDGSVRPYRRVWLRARDGSWQ